jgi:predicted SprT family Zn-dependent metalloprotease
MLECSLKGKTMTSDELHNKVIASADNWWGILQSKYPTISKIRPAVKYNKRLKTTAGRAFIENKPQYIDLSNELLWEHPNDFFDDTIPHELAHCAAYTVFGDSGHGIGWKTVMRAIGLEPTRCHNMVNSKHEERKLIRMGK